MAQRALLVVLLCWGAGGESLPPPCSSDIYCYGDLLHTVQMSSIFHDSKEFVDMKMKYPPNETLNSFNEMMQRTSDKPSKSDIEAFVNATFDPAGSEFETWDPSDWKESPSFLKKVHDLEFRDWGSQLNNLWKFLGRKMKDDVAENPELYSIIYIPHPVIVPGGRFREFYYWDSYWILRGLLLSEMTTTAKGILGNFLYVVDKYGFVPNGGRIYYSMRSQPPVLIPMMKSYLDKTNDLAFIKDNIDIMEKEFHFWTTNRTVTVEKDGNNYTLAHYMDSSFGPRPESYKEDYVSAEIFSSQEEKEDYYSELKAAAESGWDFSTRWFIKNATNKGNITNLKTRFIVPVDLNSLIYWNADILADFYSLIGNYDKSITYRLIAKDWMKAVTEVLWHDDVGAWLDYDTMNKMRRDYFYPTNIAPLWTGCFDIDKRDSITGKVMKYLERSQVMVNLGGIPTTFEHSGEQWDFPNAWPPLQYIMVMGLEASNDGCAKDLAFEIAERWARSNFKAFRDTNAMFEKYDATLPGGHGSGGEYEVQLGFGWTNGVIMELLDKYGDRLTAEDNFIITPSKTGINAPGKAAAPSSVGPALAGVLALLVAMAAGCIGMYMYRRRHEVRPAFDADQVKRYPNLLGGYTELKDMGFD